MTNEEKNQLDETVPGGRYIVGGQTVNAEGEALKSNAGDSAYAGMTKADLLKEAESRGARADKSMKNDEIIALLEGE